MIELKDRATITAFAAGPCILLPQPEAPVTQQDIEFLARLEAFEAPYLRNALCSKGVFPNERSYERAFAEFKKFVALNRFCGNGLTMTSHVVDELWHNFILFTRGYAEFCERFLGYFLHHEPAASVTTISDVEDDERFEMAYRSIFGALDGLWVTEVNCSSCRGGGKHCKSCKSATT